ncbi:hypothetical protein CERZMDRAFT_80373 [Cercospora zeae-maydis SCOH1-5]|uniref:Heme haloperoxidase family profile domain-containing protein n=1 Tax=Cercospora zeae-maydis SCOH1-5 TaxID=717836 RepID=A0A6A6FWA6_9PEZI|nr:hypothetical protein CERZMDRAFT_80373 [Cercospora zeae-maydis SCOH1-5]
MTKLPLAVQTTPRCRWHVAGGEVILDGLTTYRSQRFDRPIANNRYFFNGPFPGLHRFMANHSEEDPIGTLSYSNIQSWFGIEGEDGSYVARQGYERIPENWYRRSMTAPYTIPYFLGDVLNAARLHPKFLNVGGSLDRKTNNFAGVDITNLTGGVFNGADLLQGNNLGCFAFQTVTQVKTHLIVDDILNNMQSAVGSIVTQLGCPAEGYGRCSAQAVPRLPKGSSILDRCKLGRVLRPI